MEGLFETIRQNRNVLAQILLQTPQKQLITIPPGFANNIWWNIAHVVVTHQLLLYGLSNLPMAVGEDLISRYRKGTFPQGEPGRQEIAEIQELLIQTAHTAEVDFKAGKFVAFREYTTSVGVRLQNFKDALAFDAFHEGLHLGVVISLKKLV